MGHHLTYELGLPDGRTLRTRISRPVNKTEYGARVESHILRDQLEVSRDEFWACVDDGTIPVRSQPTVPKESIPASIVKVLLADLHLSETQVQSLTREEAIRLANEFWSR